MLSTIRTFLILTLAASASAWAQHGEPQPGDYGYRHMEYHRNGIIDELRRKTGRSCCDNIGECRATYVDMEKRTVFLDGKWCPISRSAVIRHDIALPDHFALVCAGRSAGPQMPCPFVYCVAVALGT
ncbi:MAG: hypothetical protein ACREC6_06645 [Hyphomicrobiaceae bacterium]